MRLLIIEDEKKTAAHLQKGLSENGFTVDVAHDGAEGSQLACAGGYALIVLDVMLPQRDGWAILGELRQGGVGGGAAYIRSGNRHSSP
jgi:two-component system copper resistance phosphate regulon response regulator CusR